MSRAVQPPPPRLSPAESPFTRRLDRRVLRYVRKHDVLRAGERVVVAVSGGPDSTALLLLLSRLRGELEIELAVAHFDHMLRDPSKTAADAEFVRALAGALSLPFSAGRGHVRLRARRSKQSIEEAARHMRYAFLARQARPFRAGVVAIGHTRDDRAETVLLHLMRGSGLDGLVGLRPRSSWPFGRGPAVARPLLEVSRAETERYCLESGVEPRHDPTNELLVATRNRIRHEFMPALRRFNPRLEEALARLGDAVADDIAQLDAAADEAWRSLARRQRSAVSFATDGLAALPRSIAARLLRRAARHLLGPTADLESVHIEGVLDCLPRRRASLSLPGLTAKIEGGELRVLKGRPALSVALPETAVPVPGRARVGPWEVAAELVAPPARFEGLDVREAFLDPAVMIDGKIIVRARRPGDRLRPLGLGGEKKVQDILVDAGVPRDERDTVPIVAAPWGIAWVAGQRLDERAALGPGISRAVHVRFRRGRRR